MSTPRESEASEAAAQAMRAAVADMVASKGRKTSKKAWVAPVLEDFAHGRVLAFDQTLTKTGFALVVRDHAGFHVQEGNLLLPDVDTLVGFEATFDKARQLGLMLVGLLTLLGDQADVVVHEMPSVSGYRVESSLMAAREVRRAVEATARLPVEMVSNQMMKALLLAPGHRTSKAEVSAMVDTWVPPERRHAKRWNEDVRDAVALALTSLHRKARS